MCTTIRSRLALALLLLSTWPAVADAETLLPRPDSLGPAVRFWERVYTEVDGNGGFLHDAVHLDVVYETLRFPEQLSRPAREREVEKEKRRIREILESLAKGPRTGLSPAEAEVLARWPDGVSSATLRAAASNLRFQLGQANRFREGLIRSGAWIEHIEQTLAYHGVPTELSALPHVESSFNPKAYSRVGAAGLWQFTRPTGRLYLRIDSVVDERLDPFKATDAAARLLKKNLELTGSWPLAITAYNHGAGGMQRAKRQLGTEDIGTIVRRYKGRTFGFASRNFYASFLAALEVSRHADRYFGALAFDRPVDYATLELPHYYRAAALAEALNVDLATLREHNNDLRPAVWQGTKYVPRGYQLRVPRRYVDEPAPALLARIPASERLAKQHIDEYYKVRRGDTLSRIASQHGVRESELVALNNLRSRHRIRVGQVLVLPSGAGPALTPAVVASEPTPDDGLYRVRQGDSVWTIARRFGVSQSALAAANGLDDRRSIQVGQTLRIPGASPTVIASAAPLPAPVAPPQPAEPARQPAPSAPVPPVAPQVEPVSESLIEARDAAAPTAEDVGAVAAVEETATEDAVVEEAVVEEALEEAVAEESLDEEGPIEEALAEPEAMPADAPESLAPPAAMASADAGRRADPSDYAVHADGRITVQAAETIGHYAEWLEVRASQLRAKNGMRYGQPLVIGRQIHLDFERVAPAEFERRRLEYHQTLQDEFFSAFVVTGTETHVLRSGETLWYLAERKYRVPLWLLRQYNPDLDFGSLPAGTSMVVPQIEPRRDA